MTPAVPAESMLSFLSALVRGPRRAGDVVLAGVYGSALLAYASFCTRFFQTTACPLGDGRSGLALFDDAMISMRYARQLADGQGLVFNAGERVEGYTNFLWVVLQTPLHMLFDRQGAVYAVAVLGACCVMAAAMLASRLCAQVLRALPGTLGESAWARRWLPCAAFLATLVYYPLSYWSLMGMEVGFLAVLLLGAANAGLASSRTGAALGTSVLCGLAVLTRPDAVVPASFLLLMAATVRLAPLWRARAGRSIRLLIGPSFWSLLPLGVPVLAMGSAHLVFRFAYYGKLVPNTYLLKVEGHPLAQRIEAGLAFIEPFLWQLAPLLAISVVVLLLVRHKTMIATVGAPFAVIVYQVLVGGDAWQLWRFLAPVMPLFCVGVLTGVAAAMAGRSRSVVVFGPRFAVAASGVLVMLGLWRSNEPFEEEIVSGVPSYATQHCSQLRTARFLSTALAPDATIAVAWAGIVPYFTGRRTIDILGKMDPRIASMQPRPSVVRFGMPYLPGHDKYDLEYSIGVLKPDYAERLAWADDRISSSGQYRTTHHGAFLRGSERVNWDRLLRAPSGKSTQPGADLAVRDAGGHLVAVAGPGHVVEPLEKGFVRGWMATGRDGESKLLQLDVPDGDRGGALELFTGYGGSFGIPDEVKMETVHVDGTTTHGSYEGAPEIVMPLPTEASTVRLWFRIGQEGRVGVRGVRVRGVEGLEPSRKPGRAVRVDDPATEPGGEPAPPPGLRRRIGGERDGGVRPERYVPTIEVALEESDPERVSSMLAGQIDDSNFAIDVVVDAIEAPLCDALRRAIARGVDVRVVVSSRSGFRGRALDEHPSVCSTDGMSVAWYEGSVVDGLLVVDGPRVPGWDVAASAVLSGQGLSTLTPGEAAWQDGAARGALIAVRGDPTFARVAQHAVDAMWAQSAVERDRSWFREVAGLGALGSETDAIAFSTGEGQEGDATATLFGPLQTQLARTEGMLLVADGFSNRVGLVETLRPRAERGIIRVARVDRAVPVVVTGDAILFGGSLPESPQATPVFAHSLVLRGSDADTARARLVTEWAQ